MHKRSTVAVITIDHSIIVLLQQNYANASIFLSYESFFAKKGNSLPDCLVIDARTSDITQTVLEEQFLRPQFRMPIIILSRKNDANIAINSMKAGAFDFLIAPINHDLLHKRITRALAYQRKQKAEYLYTDELTSRFNRLSEREKSVLHFITQGKLNKTVAKILNISTKTVELHRTNASRKMKVNSFCELVEFYFTTYPTEAINTLFNSPPKKIPPSTFFPEDEIKIPAMSQYAKRIAALQKKDLSKNQVD